MQPATSYIEASSRREAMDWSLVLVSQGIESTIEQRCEDGQWQLGVLESDLVHARHSIKQFVSENATVWRREIRGTGLLFDWRSIFCGLILVSFFALAESVRPELLPQGRMDSTAVRAGEWWRLFTAVTLHADVAHLAANVSTGFILLGLAMGAWGSGVAMLTCFISGATANGFAMLLRPEAYLGVGASGMVMAALGLLAADALICGELTSTRKRISRGVLGAALLLVLLGFNPASDVLAHVGGFISGGVAGLILHWITSSPRYARRYNAFAGLLVTVLLIVCWAFALRNGS